MAVSQVALYYVIIDDKSPACLSFLPKNILSDVNLYMSKVFSGVNSFCLFASPVRTII
jgi:hypothetical protein